MNKIKLSKNENKQIDILIQELLNRFKSPSNKSFLIDIGIYANCLPKRIIRALNKFKYAEDNFGALLVSNFFIDNKKIGYTPLKTSKYLDENSAPREGFMLMLLSSLLGNAIGWDTQRDGAIINNILPIKGFENEQLSSGSIVDLDWHTEEAFHPFRADYLGLMCLRNHDKIPTILGSINDLNIDNNDKEILFAPRFIFLKDKNFDHDEKEINPEAALFGHHSSPYVRIDPSFMKTLPNDNQAQHALEKLINEFNKSLKEVILKRGDILLIDNYRVIHGRKSFKPRFDGTDRWLKRVNISIDLRKSRANRKNNISRVILTS